MKIDLIALASEHDALSKNYLNHALFSASDEDARVASLAERSATALRAAYDALAPLANVANAWDADGLDEDRPDWRRRRVGASYRPPFDQVELLSGRGGRTLLTLADAFRARAAIGARGEPNLDGSYAFAAPISEEGRAMAAAIADGPKGPEFNDAPVLRADPRMPPFLSLPDAVREELAAFERAHRGGSFPSGAMWDRARALLTALAPPSANTSAGPAESPIASPVSGARDKQRDLDYLAEADAHADEGPLGERAARSILAIALYWLRMLDVEEHRAEAVGAENAHLREREAHFAAALRRFPELAEGPLTAERVEAVAGEHVKMIVEWWPVPKELAFVDDDGNQGVLTFVAGEPESGVRDGWSFDGAIVDGAKYDAMTTAAAKARGLLEAIFERGNAIVEGPRFTPEQLEQIGDVVAELQTAFARKTSESKLPDGFYPWTAEDGDGPPPVTEGDDDRVEAITRGGVRFSAVKSSIRWEHTAPSSPLWRGDVVGWRLAE